MNDFNDPINYMDTLLGSDFSELLLAIPGSADMVHEKLLLNKELFQEKILSLNLPDPTPENIHIALQSKLGSIEDSLRNRFSPESLASSQGINNIVTYAYTLCPHNETGWYIKTAAAKKLLIELPPKNLIAFMETHDLGLSSLQQLAMTRHTESDDWQLRYNEHLEQLTPDDFEERPVAFIVLDTKQLQPLLDISGQQQKPWRISHTKEAGIITCFTLDNYETYPMPVLLYLSVFMHYFFETSCSGLFFGYARNNSPEAFGNCIKKTITTGKNKLPFFHSNAYSENLFWKKAIQLLNQSHPSDALNYFADTLTCGERISADLTSPLIPLNIVDHIWSANFSKQVSAEAYFKLTSRNYLYHFREGFWYELFADILKLTEDQMDTATINHLDIGDTDFTRVMIEQYSK